MSTYVGACDDQTRANIHTATACSACETHYWNLLFANSVSGSLCNVCLCVCVCGAKFLYIFQYVMPNGIFTFLFNEAIPSAPCPPFPFRSPSFCITSQITSHHTHTLIYIQTNSTAVNVDFSSNLVSRNANKYFICTRSVVVMAYGISNITQWNFPPHCVCVYYVFAMRLNWIYRRSNVKTFHTLFSSPAETPLNSVRHGRRRAQPNCCSFVLWQATIFPDKQKHINF